MVIFKKVRWQNFLSTGNAFTEIDLVGSNYVLCFGKNGSGKSTFLDAIVFGLFGKAFRNINKPALVNSINDKNCVVEIEFDIDSKSYKVVRGIKPAVFYIYCDGELLNQDSALKDYQAVLEKQILKFNYKTFTQVVILGSANYVPFMALPLASRREVIEDLLDIRIFSIMNGLLKDKTAKTKDDLTHIDSSLEVAKERAKAQQKVISILESNAKERRGNIEAEIQNNIDILSNNIDKIERNDQLIDENFEGLSTSINSVTTHLDDLRAELNSSKKDIAQIDKQIKFFHETDSCSVCQQTITEDHKHSILDGLMSSKDIAQDCVLSVNRIVDERNKDLEELNSKMKVLTDLQTASKILKTENKKLQARNRELTESLKQNTDDQLVDEKSKLKELAANATKVIERKELLTKLKHIQETCSLLLKDGGIKTAIIKEYLPIFNRFINKYLGVMELYVDFQLDETFNESMKSRFRDTFTYSSFSEGEKQRIDLALLFTFREIARLKNSLSCNLLVLDEVFDSSLDMNGVDFVMSLLQEFTNTNTFIISHNINMISSDIFDTTIQFEKVGDFSVKRTDKSRFSA